jgi:CDP-2,3-bis-(O-geranylgeranyl)-sn-glycerol synthase
MAPVICWQLNCLDCLRRPLDNGLKLGGRPLLGPNKTYFGLFSAVLGGIFGAAIAIFMETLMGNFYLAASLMDWRRIILYALWGATIGLGAIIGDTVKSLIKRRFGVAPGKPFVPWDQIDFVIGAWFFHQIYFAFLGHGVRYFWLPEISWEVLLLGMITIPPLHLLANLLAYKLKWKKVWW